MLPSRLIPLLLLTVTLTACSKQGAQPAAETKRYQLKGKVISLDKQSHMATIDSEAIPGFMSAMAMPYTVKPENTLDRLSPGDAIAADVVLQEGNYWLENVVVSHASSPPKLPAPIPK